jgi:hypothetical protein
VRTEFRVRPFVDEKALDKGELNDRFAAVNWRSALRPDERLLDDASADAGLQANRQTAERIVDCSLRGAAKKSRN